MASVAWNGKFLWNVPTNCFYKEIYFFPLLLAYSTYTVVHRLPFNFVKFLSTTMGTSRFSSHSFFLAFFSLSFNFKLNLTGISRDFSSFWRFLCRFYWRDWSLVSYVTRKWIEPAKKAHNRDKLNIYCLMTTKWKLIQHNSQRIV